MDEHPGASVSSPGSEAAAGWCRDLARVRAATAAKAAAEAAPRPPPVSSSSPERPDEHRRRGRLSAERPLARSSPAQDRRLDRIPDRAARRPPSPRRRRLGLAGKPLGHPHADLDRVHHPGLSLPGPPDGAHRARLVRDPSLRVSRRHDVHGGPRGLCRRGRAQQLRPREPGHVRHAADVRGDRAGGDVPGRTGRLRRPEDLLLRDRNADLHLSVQPGGWLVRLPVRQRMGCALQPRAADAGDHRWSDPSPRAAAADLLALVQGAVGEGHGRARRSWATSART